MKTVPESLTELGRLYQERGAVYGDDYKRHGAVMAALFPQGVFLQTPKDFNRFALFVHIMTKVGRYSKTFVQGGHPDSLNDLAVYATMLNEIDQEEGR